MYSTMNFETKTRKPKMVRPRMAGINPYRFTNQPPSGAKNAEQTAKIMIQVQMWTRWRSSASSTIRQVQAVCEMRHRLFNKAAATKKRKFCATAQIRQGRLQEI